MMDKAWWIFSVCWISCRFPFQQAASATNPKHYVGQVPTTLHKDCLSTGTSTKYLALATQRDFNSSSVSNRSHNWNETNRTSNLRTLTRNKCAWGHDQKRTESMNSIELCERIGINERIIETESLIFTVYALFQSTFLITAASMIIRHRWALMQEGSVYWKPSQETETLQRNTEMHGETVRDMRVRISYSAILSTKKLLFCASASLRRTLADTSKALSGKIRISAYSQPHLVFWTKVGFGLCSQRSVERSKGCWYFANISWSDLLFLCSLILQYVPLRETPSERLLYCVCSTCLGQKCNELSGCKELFLYQCSI